MNIMSMFSYTPGVGDVVSRKEDPTPDPSRLYYKVTSVDTYSKTCNIYAVKNKDGNPDDDNNKGFSGMKDINFTELILYKKYQKYNANSRGGSRRKSRKTKRSRKSRKSRRKMTKRRRR